MTIAVELSGQSALDIPAQLRKRIPLAQVRAVNTAARDARTKGARMIREQVNLPASYLAPRNGRLIVTQKANRARPEARITARSRPTSLARFTRGSPARGRQIGVAVKPGRFRALRRAFFIRLRVGAGSTDTRFNLGLAIRLRPGERISNKYSQVTTRSGLTLLYGPSVQQVFLDNEERGVARDLEIPTLNRLESEFLRLLRL